MAKKRKQHSLQWMDSRSEYDGLPSPQIISEEAVIGHASLGYDFVLVVTHDHSLDYKLVYAALSGSSPWVGLIGSKTKRERFGNHLTRDGVPSQQLEKLCCPIGLPGIPGKEPQVIAIAVAAQVLSLKRVCQQEDDS